MALEMKSCSLEDFFYHCDRTIEKKCIVIFSCKHSTLSLLSFFYFRSTCLQDNRKLIVRRNDSDGAYSFSFNWTNIGKIFWWIPEDFIEVRIQEKKRKSCYLVSASFTKREILRYLCVVVVQCTLVQSCCFANQTYWFFAVLAVVAVPCLRSLFFFIR